MRSAPWRVGFLGAGQMATALAAAWGRAGLLHPASRASDPSAAARQSFQATTAIEAIACNREIVRTCEVLLLAVKPQVMPALLQEIQPDVTDQHLIISIAAGVTLRQLADSLGAERRLVRVMPNTPCLVAASATGYSVGPKTTAEDLAIVEQLFGTVGKAFALAEPLLDAVTGLSGSGPAFVYVMIEALADGGVRMGLPREVALSLAAQTVLGAAKMVLETGVHPAVLKDRVASPGGTTIAGLHALERAGVRAGLIDAVEAAAQRSVELGHGRG